MYNIGGKSERRNVDVVREILRILGKPESLMRFVTDRSGHDRRYAMDIGRIEQTVGWNPGMTFEQSRETAVEWYARNAAWGKRVPSEAYCATRSLYPGG